MDEHIVILTIALLILGYGYISKALASFYISGPMVFTGVGVLLSPLGLNHSTVEVDAEFVTIIVEIALVLVLFSDAALLDLKLLKKSWKLPARLLFIGLPITIVFSTLVGLLIFPNQPPINMLLLALLLTPTDAALGKAVVSDPIVPQHIRSTINVESGLNDGMIFPLLLAVIAVIASGASTGSDDTLWFVFVAEQIVFGAFVGAGVGYLGTKISQFTLGNKWMQGHYQNLIPIALAILSFYLAESVHGNGFIAAFFAGLYAGNTCIETRKHIEGFAESEGELFVLVSFFIFGVAFVPKIWPFFSIEVVVYGLLSLTVLRMLPVLFSLVGSKLAFSTMTFIAWFGPRGIASILYVLIVVHHMGVTNGLETVYAVVMITVLMSIIVHGVTAQPLANWYSKHHKPD